MASPGVVAMCFCCGAERRLEGTMLSKCGKCKTAFYCSKQCQLADWPQHKMLCKSLKKVVESDHPLTQAAGHLPNVADLFEFFEDPLCVTSALASEMGGETAELLLLLLRHGMPQKVCLPKAAYKIVARLL